jgi:transposase InsO family protein
MFRINEVLCFENQLYRILADLAGELVWISLGQDDALPSIISKNTLQEAIELEALKRVDDPYQDKNLAILECDSHYKAIRDKNYALIKPIISDPRFFLPKIRSAHITKILNDEKTTKKHIYHLLRKYWQRGQSPNSLIPDYKNSGGKGKKRVANKKLGRPRVYSEGVGAIVDEIVEKLFRIAIDRHYLQQKKNSMAYAHRRFQDMYKNYYPDIAEPEMPTKWQFMHFFKREYNQVEKIQKRSKLIDYQKDLRPLHGTASSQALGPGSRYEIDATIADIYLVSDSDRKNIVGRPIVYVVIDVFSRLVAGFYVGFENPSYIAAMQALAMAMTDKVEYCKQFDINIAQAEWPAVGLPEAILADRGELLGHQIESLESSFSIRIENAPPYRGDAKGIVERYFRTLQADFKPFSPGVVTGNSVKKRGGNDYRLDAKLSIKDFKEIILECVLFHNQFKHLPKYDRSADMPADLEIAPVSLWNWGLQHRTGRLRSAPEEALRISLYPRAKGSISELGLCVFGVYYTSPEMVKQGWLHRGKEVSRPGALEVAYDPAVADYVYLLPVSNSIEYWVCKLSDRSREFRGCSFWEVWEIQGVQKKTAAKTNMISNQKQRELENKIVNKIKKAEVLAATITDQPKTERIAAIRKNRQQAKDLERKEAVGFQQESNKSSSSADVISLAQQNDDYSYPSFIDELFGDN